MMLFPQTESTSLPAGFCKPCVSVGLFVQDELHNASAGTNLGNSVEPYRITGLTDQSE